MAAAHKPLEDLMWRASNDRLLEHNKVNCLICPHWKIILVIEVIVISRYECDIRVIDQDRGEAEVMGDDRISHE